MIMFWLKQDESNNLVKTDTTTSEDIVNLLHLIKASLTIFTQPNITTVALNHYKIINELGSTHATLTTHSRNKQANDIVEISSKM